MMHTGGSLLWQGAGRDPSWSAGSSPLHLIFAPSDPRLLDTHCTGCAVQPGTAAWQSHTEDHILCSQ